MTSPWWLPSIGAGIVSATLFGIAPLSPLAAIMVAAPLFTVGLGIGAFAVATSALAGFVAALVIYGPTLAVAFVMGFGVPVTILVRQAMLSRRDDNGTEWYPAGSLAVTLTVLGLAMAMALSAVLVPLGLLEQAEAMLSQFAEDFAAGSNGISAEALMDRIRWITRLLPGMLIGFWMLAMLAGGTLAQALLQRMGRNLRPAPNVADMELPNWMATVAAAAMAAAMLLPEPAGIYAAAVAFAACFAFLVQGLAVVHALNGKIRGGAMPLAIFYLLVFAPVWPATLVVLLGAVEQFAGFRRRLKKPDE